MSTATAYFALEKGAEPIPGYRLEERIGVGGYGEVWRTTAPGGLSKALKIIHGRIDDSRAVRELRAMERAKSLKHPFLLSLERIEIVDGHLIIVTELAEATLRERYEQCQAEELPGIPRPELLEYMREAADALDHLYDSHALQHLDVKPENLLLVSKHLKVADFGLLKDLQESCGSFVSGLTPKYSAPEVFGGKPGRNSDQYSLAIVYHEMVSGQLPFAGNNLAALASQHLHAAPNLAALAPLERFAVGKALSKDPQSRFPNCLAFVERLMHRSSAAIIPTASSGPEPGVIRGNAPPPQVHDGQTMNLAAPEVRSLARVQPDASPLKFRPTVFIGIGGTGGRVLSKLRQLLTDRVAPANALPALQFLYVDTDADAIKSIAAGPGNEGLREDEILITPLRQTQDYRSSVVSNLESISRRWIYNIPRTLRTQGIRALGRIALLDHADRLLDRLRNAVRVCTDAPSIKKTAEESGLNFTEADPRVFVVASIAGGTGGGMVIDTGYAIRQVLAECGFTDDDVCGLLAYSTSRGPAACNFAAANAFACLEELRYFSQPGCDYPGEPACDLAGFREHGSTFRSTYLFDLGADLSGDDYSVATDALCEYLFLSTVSNSSGLFDQCRRAEQQTPDAESLRIRTAGLCPFTSATHEDPAHLAELLCKFVVRKWKVGINSATHDERIKLSDIDRLYEACDPQGQSNDRIGNLAHLKLDELRLDLKSLTDRIVHVAKDKLGAEPRDYLSNIIRDSLDEGVTDKNRQSTALDIAVKRIRTIIGSADGLETHRESQIDRLSDQLMPEARAIGVQLGESLASWILDLVDTENARVNGARQAEKCLSECLCGLQQTAVQQTDSAKLELEAASRAIAALDSKANLQRKSAREMVTAALQNYAERLLGVLLHEAVCKVLRAVDPMVTAASDRLRELWKDLTQLAEEFHVAYPPPATANEIADHAKPNDGPASMADVFAVRQKDLIEELDKDLAEGFFTKERRLCEILSTGSRERSTLAVHMRASARKIIVRACNDSSYAYLRQALTEDVNQGLATLMRRCLESARPRLLDLGGAKRLLLVIPNKLDVTRLAREVEAISLDRVSVSVESDGDLKVCYEVEDLPWEGLQIKLIRQRHDCQSLAARLHTRVNVDWTVI